VPCASTEMAENCTFLPQKFLRFL